MRAVPVLESQVQSIDRYENLGIVGRGAFNKIYKARHRQTGEVVALKAMQLSTLEQAGQVEGGEGVPLEMMREMSILMCAARPRRDRLRPRGAALRCWLAIPRPPGLGAARRTTLPALPAANAAAR